MLSFLKIQKILQISQISCHDPYNLAPDGCTQYFQGTTGTLQTFNYANSNQLANQMQNMCIRYELFFQLRLDSSDSGLLQTLLSFPKRRDLVASIYNQATIIGMIVIQMS